MLENEKVETNLIVDDIEIIFEKTTPRELIERGYELKDFVQIIEEPTVAECYLYKDDKPVARLYFWNLKELIEIDQLLDVPIDEGFIDTKAFRLIKFTIKQKIAYNVIIQLISLVIFYLLSYFESFLENNISIGVLLVSSPSIICTIIWCNNIIAKKENIFKIVVVCISTFLNLLITILLLGLVYNSQYV